MKELFDGPFPEPSALTGFAQNRLIRDSENRDGETLARALADPSARFHLFSGAKALVRKDEQPTATFTALEARSMGADEAGAVLLGVDEHGPRLAAPLSLEGDPAEPLRLYDFRSLLYSSAVTDEEAGAIAQAGSLLHWHAMNRFCGKCGQATAANNGGYRRDCSCGSQIFPRTDPVVIMLALRDEAALLGRSPHFPPGWYSTLAGFIEPGETIEDAVRRETFEESGIHIGRVRYHASQPWPFPHSLMIGCHCEALSEDITFDGKELEDCRWFSRDEVRQMIADTHPGGLKCPPTKAIASFLIRAWAEG
ncbi:MAG: NAD(+) diphosphatase [Nitratireductor sp.]|nr:NAD(+) diphosphatase [Nitratireductor sp.]